jgi:antitoxin ParD1/3/4
LLSHYPSPKEDGTKNVSVGERRQRFVEQAVNSGRYGSASEVVREGLRLVEEREARLAALRDSIDRAIAEGGEHSDADVAAALDAEAERLARND